MQRRERTRHLIELGGLVQKAGLVDLTDDDRATIYGALLELVGRARGDDAGDGEALDAHGGGSNYWVISSAVAVAWTGNGTGRKVAE